MRQPLSIILISLSRFLERENYLINGWNEFLQNKVNFSFIFFIETIFIYTEHTTSTERHESLHFNFLNYYLLSLFVFPKVGWLCHMQRIRFRVQNFFFSYYWNGNGMNKSNSDSFAFTLERLTITLDKKNEMLHNSKLQL